MKTIFVKCLAPAVLLGSMILPVMAQAPANVHHRGINARLRRQNARIEQGDNSGRLNERQENHLEARDARIHRQEHRDRRHDHGHLTVGEHRRLERELNNTSGAIYRKKH